MRRSVQKYRSLAVALARACIFIALIRFDILRAQAFDAARLEEEYNVERWGLIEGGHDMDRANTTLTLTAASTLLWLRNASLPEPKLSSSR